MLENGKGGKWKNCLNNIKILETKKLEHTQTFCSSSFKLLNCIVRHLFLKELTLILVMSCHLITWW